MNGVVEAEDPSLEAASSPEVASNVNVYVHSVGILVFVNIRGGVLPLYAERTKHLQGLW